PLGMTTATSRVADYRAAKDRALMHVRVAGKWTVSATELDTDVLSPSGGVYCSVRDLTPWLRLHLAGGKFAGKQVVPAAALAETHRPQVISGIDAKSERPAMYGLGWEVYWDAKGRRVIKHNGAHSTGARTEVALLPGEDLGI